MKGKKKLFDYRSFDPMVDGVEPATRAIPIMYNYRSRNWRKEEYYNGTVCPAPRSSVIPFELAKRYTSSLHWGRLAVDAVAERLFFRKWIDTSEDGYGLNEIYEQNNLGSEVDRAILDSLIYGVGYITVGAGDLSNAEPSVVIRGLSPNHCFGQWDNRSRKLKSAVSVVPAYEDFDIQTPNLWQERFYITIYNEFSTSLFKYDFGECELVDVDYHNLGFCPVVRLSNATGFDRIHGKSEITRPMRSYIDIGINILRAMQINSDFYSMPRYYVLNADIQDELTESNRSALEMIAATIWSVNGGNGPLDREPKIGQLSPATPAPYTAELECIAQQFASEAAIPQSYLGFVSDQNISADSIRAAESTLIKRVEKKQALFTPGLIDLARTAVAVRDGSVPDDFNKNVSVSWDDPASQARSAATDQALKLVSAGIVPPDSSILLKNIGYSEEEIREVQEARKKTSVQQILDTLKQKNSDLLNSGLGASAQTNALLDGTPNTFPSDAQTSPIPGNNLPGAGD